MIPVAMALVVLAIGLEVAYGADLSDSLLYLAYETGFVVLPGWFAYRALRPAARAGFATFAIGWALGYVLEVLTFNLTAALGARDLFFLYPLVVVAAAVLWRRSRDRPSRDAEPPSEPLTRRMLWTIAAVCAGAMVYFALALFSGPRLPGDGNVIYNQDTSWAISLAAEIKNHWPFADPNVSGEPLPYHYFVSAHLAAASQTTGIELPLIFLRLYTLPLAVCLMLQLVAAGQILFRRLTIGVLASGLTLFVGELQLDPRRALIFHIPFVGVFFTLLLASPSFLFGLVLFVPLIVLIGERIAADRGGGTSLPGWFLIALFMLGASDAKITILPLITVALGIYLAWVLWAERRISAPALTAAAIALVVQFAIYAIQYAGSASGVGLDIGAGFDFIQNMPAVSLVRDGLEAILPEFTGSSALLSIASIPFGLLGLFAAQLSGLWFVFRHRADEPRSVHVWLTALLLAGVLAIFTLRDVGAGNQLYFLFTGLVAGCLLSAAGLHEAWAKRPVTLAAPRVALFATLALGALAAIVATPFVVDLFSGPEEQALTYLLWYGGLALILAGVYLLTRGRAGLAAAVVCVTLIAVGSIGTPVDWLVDAIDGPTERSEERVGLTPDLYEALAWVRDSTPTETVVAVSNPGVFEFQYAAFTERRLFLGAWGYSERSRGDYADVSSGRLNPFTDRFVSNAAAFGAGDASAAQMLANEYGVRYLVVDKVNGPSSDLAALRHLGITNFENGDAAVIEINLSSAARP